MQNNYNFIISKTKKPCWICEKLTNQIEINYEAYICSSKCEKIADEAYIKYLQNMINIKDIGEI